MGDARRLANSVIVGTKQFGPDSPQVVDGLGHEYGFEWVRIGDVVLTSAEHCLISVRYEADGNGFSKVFIELSPSSFTTVDSDLEPGSATTDDFWNPAFAAGRIEAE